MNGFQLTLRCNISILLLFIIGARGNPGEVLPLSRPKQFPTPEKLLALTLVEVWQVVDDSLQKERPEAIAVSLSSADEAGASPSSGQDGRRRRWQAVAVDQSHQLQLWLELLDGAVIQAIVQPPTDLNTLASLQGPVLDSPQALLLAQNAEPNLKPEDGKTKGYHFSFEASSEGGTLTILGEAGDMPAVVRMRADSGGNLAVQKLGFNDSGGILYSNDGGQTWQASDLTGTMVKDIDVGSSPDEAYAVALQENNILIYQSRDGGLSWDQIGKLPNEAGNWPFSMGTISISGGKSELLVGTWTGL